MTLADLAETIACSACGAGVRRPCVTMTSRGRPAGTPANYYHAARLRPLRGAWFAGIDEGRETALDMVDMRIRRHARELGKDPDSPTTYGYVADWLQTINLTNRKKG